MVIYPGKVAAKPWHAGGPHGRSQITNADCFRIGHIGHLFPSHTRELVEAIAEVRRDALWRGLLSRPQVSQEMGFDPRA